ncbi:MAG: hydroxymethylpyrimidine/phosphomethylpyrimidine kinase, partial [Bradymonadia bacterium]
AWPHDVHGTGCALATAIATSAARGATWQDAVSAAKRWIDAIALDPARVRQVGRGRHQFVPRVWR